MGTMASKVVDSSVESTVKIEYETFIATRGE
jgi:hypothetical protein